MYSARWEEWACGDAGELRWARGPGDSRAIPSNHPEMQTWTRGSARANVHDALAASELPHARYMCLKEVREGKGRGNGSTLGLPPRTHR